MEWYYQIMGILCGAGGFIFLERWLKGYWPKWYDMLGLTVFTSLTWFGIMFLWSSKL